MFSMMAFPLYTPFWGKNILEYLLLECLHFTSFLLLECVHSRMPSFHWFICNVWTVNGIACRRVLGTDDRDCIVLGSDYISLAQRDCSRMH